MYKTIYKLVELALQSTRLDSKFKSQGPGLNTSNVGRIFFRKQQTKFFFVSLLFLNQDPLTTPNVHFSVYCRQHWEGN